MNVQALKNFRVNLRALMEARGISQRDLADSAGISYPHVNRILMDKVEPSLPICDQLADALDVPLTDLLSAPSKNGKRALHAVSR